MKSLKEQFIEHVVEEVVRRVGNARSPRILELGCGTAAYVPSFMKRYPQLHYVGVEPIPKSYAAAQKNLEGIPHVVLQHQLGYDTVPGESEGSFDLVYSLSALEHVKQLGRFVSLSAKYARPEALVVHRYDLGHALTPHSLKERLHVWMGGRCPSVLPERQFVRYVSVSEVKKHLLSSNINPIDVTYHQMPSHKGLEKQLRQVAPDTTAIDDLFSWEMKYQKDIQAIPEQERERLFPAVAVWGEKGRE